MNLTPHSFTIVIPANAGIHLSAGASGTMGSRLRGNDIGGAA
jgi:hypothetical protein